MPTAVRRQPLHAAGHLPVEGVEELAPPGVDRGHDQRGREPDREGEQVEARHADHRHPQRVGHGLGRRDADPQPGEQAGTEVDGDAR